MQLQITARRFTASPKLHDYARKKLDKLQRFYDGINDAQIIFEEAGSPPANTAELVVGVHRQRLTAQAAGPTYEQALDECVDRMRRQILRYKSKKRDINQDAHR